MIPVQAERHRLQMALLVDSLARPFAKARLNPIVESIELVFRD